MPTATPAIPALLPATYAALGPCFGTAVPAQPLPQPTWLATSDQAAALLGLVPDFHTDARWLARLSGQSLAEDPTPFASVYSGHQFGVWAGQLGDGRALLLGEMAANPAAPSAATGAETDTGAGTSEEVSVQGANHWELQLKGSGRTPYSRMGDGRAVLRSSIREFLASEAMPALGIATTRALAVVGSPMPVYRETPETAAIVTRLSPSFVRFGHFEHFAHHGLHEELRSLMEYCLQHLYPQCQDAPEPVVALLAEVAERTASLVAQWQAVGFCHGVLNTDNMSLLGLTMDYGPFQFMDGFDPAHICNHSDTQGRYAFGRQPGIAYWNLLCLGQALLPLHPDAQALRSAIDRYQVALPKSFDQAMARKLGFAQPPSGQSALLQSLFALLSRERTDYTLFWSRLAQWRAGASQSPVLDLFVERDAAAAWMLSFSELQSDTGQAGEAYLMLKNNPRYVLRNYMAQEAIDAAERGDTRVLHALLKVLQRPYDEHPQHVRWAGLPPPEAQHLVLSCSS